MKVGVFDSGVGGKSFLQSISDRFPGAEVVYKTDAKNVPYGNKTPTELLSFTIPLFQELEQIGCDAVVVACNTLSTNCITELRKSVSIPLIAVEPMIKPAAEMTKTGVVAVCATPATLSSNRYTDLKQLYASNIRVIEPNCSDWAAMIEANQENKIELDKTVSDLKDQDVDVIVLGCTHYHWIDERLRTIAGDSVRVIQPTKPVLDELARQLYLKKSM